MGSLVSQKNKAAFHVLFVYLKDLPSPATVEQTHLRVEILGQLQTTHSFEKKLARLLLKDLFRPPSNNTTRGWYNAVFRFFESLPVDIAEDNLQLILNSSQFSYRIKKRVKQILEQLNYKSQGYW